MKGNKPAIKMLPECSVVGCYQQAQMEPDFSQPPKHYYEPSKRRYHEPDGSVTPGGDLTSTISYPDKPHSSGCCYFHLKKKLGLFIKSYPLSGNRTKEIWDS